jgi:ABC-type glycerol-3-phosphate transport system substrate-binding protein
MNGWMLKRYRQAFFVITWVCVGIFTLTMSAGAAPIKLTLTENTGSKSDPVFIEEYMKMNPNVEVSVSSPTFGQLDPLLVRMAAGTGVPDVISLSSGLVSAIDRLDLLDLTPYIEKYMTAEDLADFHPRQMALGNVNGKQVGLPRYMGTIATVYNRDMFSQYGVSAPQRDAFSWNDLLAMARKFTQDTNGDGQIDRWGYHVPRAWNRMVHWAWQNEADLFPPGKPEEPTIASANFIEAWQMLADMRWEYGVMPRSGQASSNGRAEFAAGKIAAFEEGNWAVPVILGDMVGGAFAVGIAELPYNKTRATMHTTDMYAIWAGTPNPEEAFKLLMYLTSREANRIQVDYDALPPARLSQISYYMRWSQSKGFDMSATPMLWNYALPTPTLPTEWSTALVDALNSSVRDNKVPVRNALEEAERRIRAYYATSR